MDEEVHEVSRRDLPFSPWAPPAEHPLLTRRQRNRLPFDGRHLRTMRASYAALVAIGIGCLILGHSLAHVVGLSLLSSTTFDVALNRSRRQRRQLVGLSPPV
jgi:hypothetical protein